MKRLIIFSLLIFAALVGNAQNKTGYISTGKTVLDRPITFTSSDFVEATDTFDIEITSEQQFPTKQNIYATLSTVSGSPSVEIKLWGKCFSGDAYTQIGSTVTWTSSSNNPVNISAVTPNQYRYYLLRCIASEATQKAQITAFEMKVWYTSGLASSGTLTDGTATINSGAASGITTIAASGRITGTGGATITGAVSNINASSNYATNIGTGTTNAAVTIGGGSNTVAISSTGLDVSTTGALTNAASMQFVQDGDSITINPYKALKLIDARVGGQSKFYVDSTGRMQVSGNAAIGGTLAVTSTSVLTGAATFTGGFVPPSASPLIWAQGGSTVLATSGTDTQPAAGTRYWVEVYIPYNVTLTGASYLIGSVGGTDSVVVQLCNSSGVEVATTKTTGATHGALVGTAANLQSIPFTAPYAAVAGKYFLAVQFSGTTCRFRTYPIPGSKFVASSAAGAWNTKADITPGTSFTADKGPIIRLY